MTVLSILMVIRIFGFVQNVKSYVNEFNHEIQHDTNEDARRLTFLVNYTRYKFQYI